MKAVAVQKKHSDKNFEFEESDIENTEKIIKVVKKGGKHYLLYNSSFGSKTYLMLMDVDGIEFIVK